MKYINNHFILVKIFAIIFASNCVNVFADGIKNSKYSDRCYSFINQNSDKYIEQLDRDASEIASILTNQKLADGENYRKLLDEGLTRETAHSYRTIEAMLSTRIEVIAVHLKYLTILKKHKLLSNEIYQEIDSQINELNPKNIDSMLSSFINSKSQNIYVSNFTSKLNQSNKLLLSFASEIKSNCN